MARGKGSHGANRTASMVVCRARQGLEDKSPHLPLRGTYEAPGALLARRGVTPLQELLVGCGKYEPIQDKLPKVCRKSLKNRGAQLLRVGETGAAVVNTIRRHADYVQCFVRAMRDTLPVITGSRKALQPPAGEAQQADGRRICPRGAGTRLVGQRPPAPP